MITTRLNFPVNASKLGLLVQDHADLKLMWPDAEVPFNELQWREKIDPEKGTLSYWVTNDGETVGHFALRHQPGESEVWLLHVYLVPQLRRTGVAREMLALAERLASDVMFGETMCLKVRDYNQPALKLYQALGYTEFHREGDLLQMRKPLQPAVAEVSV
jgi:ribosomal protein S18 acetylase RimI-like enzyme